MSLEQEFEGKTVEHAIGKACKKLKISEESLQYEVLSHGATGIFGLVGAKKARIRIILPEPRDADRMKINRPPREKQTVHEAAEEADLNVDLDNDEIARKGEAALKIILGYMSEGAVISSVINEKQILYRIDSPESALIIGKRGQTLDAIQYILEKITNKGLDSKVRIQIDVEGYLENRKESLRELAEKLADKVRQTGKPVTVGHMNAHDRRIVHMALKNDKKVRTQSMGNGFFRKLVIFPRKKAGKKKPIEQKETAHQKTPFFHEELDQKG